MTRLYAAIDLHSSNNFTGVINEREERLYQKRLPNDAEVILRALAPFKENLEGVVVESTYNWYWLVDSLQENGYKALLANPSAIRQYEGLKYTDDKYDTFWLTRMFRLNILPVGYIYPKEERPVRDLLRGRLFFVRQRTAQILSLQSMISRNLGVKYSSNRIKRLSESDAGKMFDHRYLVIAAENYISSIRFHSEGIRRIKNEIKSHVKLRPEFVVLLTIPGIGDILGLTIMLEAGDMERFPRVENYSSYSRCVRSERISNDKKKGKGNSKNGNKYLSWAYVEAANFAIRYSPEAKKFYQRKLARTNRIVAIKALANKLARASYYIIRDQVPYDPDKLFRR
jgi:transposase